MVVYVPECTDIVRWRVHGCWGAVIRLCEQEYQGERLQAVEEYVYKPFQYGFKMIFKR